MDILCSNIARIVFVCDFNRARSVIAEHLFRKALEERKPALAEKITASSAGLLTEAVLEQFRLSGLFLPQPLFGKKPAKHVTEIMLKEEGVNLASFRSRPLTESMVRESNLVIAFSEVIKRGILRLWPSSSGKLFSLREFIEPEPNSPETGLWVEGLERGQPYGYAYRFAYYDPEYESFSMPFEWEARVVNRTKIALNKAIEKILEQLGVE